MTSIIDFFKSRHGMLVLFLLGVFVVAYFVREHGKRQGREEGVSGKSNRLAVLSPLHKQLSTEAGSSSSTASGSGDAVQKPEKVDNPSFIPFRPRPYTPPSTPEAPTKPERPTKETVAKKPPRLRSMVFYYDGKQPAEAPAAPSEASPGPKRDEKSHLKIPYGTLIRCRLVGALESTNLGTPLIALVTADVRSAGRIVIPAGSEAHGFARQGRLRDRIFVSGKWTIVLRTGDELQLSGMALQRDYNSRTGSYGRDDGSLGIKGNMVRSDALSEYRLFAAAAISTAARSQERTVEGLFGWRPRPGLDTAALEGVSTVADRYARMLQGQIQGDGLFVSVPAGTEFYIYTQNAKGLEELAPAPLSDSPGPTYEPDRFVPEDTASILRQRDELLRQLTH